MTSSSRALMTLQWLDPLDSFFPWLALHSSMNLLFFLGTLCDLLGSRSLGSSCCLSSYVEYYYCYYYYYYFQNKGVKNITIGAFILKAYLNLFHCVVYIVLISCIVKLNKSNYFDIELLRYLLHEVHWFQTPVMKCLLL